MYKNNTINSEDGIKDGRDTKKDKNIRSTDQNRW